MGTPKPVKNEGGSWTPHPIGAFPAVCCDVVDIGYVKTRWGPKAKTRFVFFAGKWVEKEIEDHLEKVPLLVMATFTSTLSKMGNLRPFLESWRGAPFKETEAQVFDVEKVFRKPAFIQVIHRETENGTYANIQTIMPPQQGMPIPPLPEGYVRVEERPDWEGPAPHPAMRHESDDWDTQGVYPTSGDDDSSDMPW